MAIYDPKRYWEARLSERFSLRGVGHIAFGEQYNRWLYRRKGVCIDRCLRGVPLEGRAVLDVGCGTGFFVDWYLQRRAQVVGIDITEVSIDRLRERFAADLRVHDIGSAEPFLTDAFDVVNMWDVVYHIVDDERFAQAMAKIAAALRPQGLFLVTDSFGASEDRLIAQHVKMRCLASHRARLQPLGFELVEVIPLYDFLNRRILGGLDNLLGAVYYVLDGLATRPSATNLSVATWRMTGAKQSR